jgi:hypothetical protein
MLAKSGDVLQGQNRAIKTEEGERAGYFNGRRRTEAGPDRDLALHEQICPGEGLSDLL